MVEYRLTLYDRDGNTVLVLPSDRLHSFTYSKFLRSGGNIEVRMHDIESFIRDLGLPQSMDYKWVVDRKDLDFQTEFVQDTIGLHRGLQHLELEARNWLNYSYAVSYSDLLMTEATGLDNDTHTGTIPEVAMAYAMDLLSQFPSIGFEPVVNPSTTVWDGGSRRYKKLITILAELADLDGAQFWINSNGNFEWFYPIDNNARVYTELGQIKGLRVVKNYIQVATHATVLGAGVDTERLTTTKYLADYYEQYGEFYFNHVVRTTSSKEIDGLDDAAMTILEDRLAEVTDVQFTLTNHPSFVYKRDFDVGHILRIDFFGDILKAMVHSVFVTLNKEGIETILVGCNYVYS